MYVIDFFTSDKYSTADLGWAKYIKKLNTEGLTDEDVFDGTFKYTMADLYDQLDDRIEVFLKFTISSYDSEYLPGYLVENNQD